MRVLSLLATLVVAVFILGACNSTDRKTANAPGNSTNAIAKNPQPNLPNTVHADGARRISVQDAQSLIAKGQAVVVDVRNQPAFDQGHIRGAKLIPVQDVGSRYNELPRDKTIITYCS